MAFYRCIGNSGGGSNPVDVYAEYAHVGEAGGRYVTVSLDKSLIAGKYYHIWLYDPTYNNIAEGIAYYQGTSVNADLISSISGRSYRVTLTGSTVGASYYNGAYRDLYAKVINVDYTQI